MNIKTIEDRIIEAADKELRAKIDAAAKPLDSLLRNGCGYSVVITDSDDKVKLAEVPWYRAMEALRVRAFEMAYEQNRREAMDAFVAKVGRLDEEMEELRQMAR